MIAWDSEGIDLDGRGQPQRTVLLGCSADVADPLQIESPDDVLSFEDIAEYMLWVSATNPDCWHIGYFFSYDQNMIIQSLHWAIKQRLYEDGHSRVTGKNGRQYEVDLIPGKMLKISRRGSDKQSITIATRFTVAYESLFPDRLDTPEYAIIEEGKKARGANSYDDIPTVRKYWQAEIMALEELGTALRDLMWDNGFELQAWSGPGAFANYLRKKFQLTRHEWGGKEDNIPMPVHEAAKSAFYGGRFEQFLAGRIDGPVAAIDINSAYPAAFCQIPSLAKGGEWVRVTGPSSPTAFGLFHVLFRAPHHPALPERGLSLGSIKWPPTFHPMPFPYRTHNKMVKYPEAVDGWYFTPEVVAAQKAFGDAVQVIDGWEWIANEPDCYPWRDVFEEMYGRRLELKAAKNPAQMVFKLGPNSMYGKMAQRIGWKRTKKAPASHTLVIAGYITSYTRALIFDVARQIPEGQLVAIETDGIYTTADPSTLDLPNGTGNWLGQWDLDRYDEMLYIQSGFYMMRKGDKWKKPKTRGFAPEQITPERLTEYLASLTPGDWPELELAGANRFTSLGASIARSMTKTGFNFPKATAMHCTWVQDKRSIDPSGKGKRTHSHRHCPACAEGQSALDGSHPLFVTRKLFKDEEEHHGYPMTKPHDLPWEAGYKEPEWILEADALGLAEDSRA
jgi:DNA polymerase type B, organellar and viral